MHSVERYCYRIERLLLVSARSKEITDEHGGQRNQQKSLNHTYLNEFMKSNLYDSSLRILVVVVYRIDNLSLISFLETSSLLIKLVCEENRYQVCSKMKSRKSCYKLISLFPSLSCTYAYIYIYARTFSFSLYLYHSPVLLLELPELRVDVKGPPEVTLPLLVSVLRQVAQPVEQLLALLEQVAELEDDFALVVVHASHHDHLFGESGPRPDAGWTPFSTTRSRRTRVMAPGDSATLLHGAHDDGDDHGDGPINTLSHPASGGAACDPPPPPSWRLASTGVKATAITAAMTTSGDICPDTGEASEYFRESIFSFFRIIDPKRRRMLPLKSSHLVAYCNYSILHQYTRKIFRYSSFSVQWT